MYKIAGLFVLLFLATGLALAQDFTIPITSKVYANMDSCYAHLQVLNHSPELKTSTEKEYYWYLNNKLHHSFGAFEGKLAHNTYTCFYSSDNLKEKGKFKKGVKTGQWIKWHPNGTIAETYKCNTKGQRTGKVKTYDNTGKLICKARYRNSKLHGKYKLYRDEKLFSAKRFKNGAEVLTVEKKTMSKTKKPGLFKRIFPSKSKAKKASKSQVKEQQKNDQGPNNTQLKEKKPSFLNRTKAKLRSIHLFKKKYKTPVNAEKQEQKK